MVNTSKIFIIKMVKIFYAYLNQDDPKKSTMKKLERYNLISKINIHQVYNKIFLTPYSEDFILNHDKYIIEIRGMAILDGSWNRINTIEKFKGKNSRILPLLLPVNPVNYGKPGKLSSLEALAAALYITDYEEMANNIISKYSWAQNFIKTNIEPLEDYKKCNNNQECIEAEKNYF